jgi:hypothetical protein
MRLASKGISYCARGATVTGCVAVLICGIAGCGSDSEPGSTATNVQRNAGQLEQPKDVKGPQPTGASLTHQTTSHREGYSGPPRPNGIIAKTEASHTQVSASAVISAPKAAPQLPAGAYRVLTVSYKTEYRSGLRPVGIRILARTHNYPAPMGGSVQLGPEDVQSGEKKAPFSPNATGPIEIEVFAYTRFGTSVGATKFSIPSGN